MGSRLHLAGFYKGWLYIACCVALLVLLVWVVERGDLHKDAAVVDQTPPESVPVNEEDLFGPSQEIKQPVDDEKAFSEESEPPREEAVAESVVEAEEVVVVSEAHDDPAHPSEAQPEAVPDQKPLAENQAEVTDKTPADTIAPVAKPDPVRQSSQIEGLPLVAMECPLLGVQAEISAHDVNIHQQLRIGLSAATEVQAMMAGTIVKIHDSPHTGRTVYVLTEDRWCIAYGGFSSLADAITPEYAVKCGEQLGMVESTLWVEVRQLGEDQRWWQAPRINPIASN